MSRPVPAPCPTCKRGFPPQWTLRKISQLIGGCEICLLPAANTGASLLLCVGHLEAWAAWSKLGRGGDPEGFLAAERSK